MSTFFLHVVSVNISQKDDMGFMKISLHHNRSAARLNSRKNKNSHQYKRLTNIEMCLAWGRRLSRISRMRISNEKLLKLFRLDKPATPTQQLLQWSTFAIGYHGKVLLTAHLCRRDFVLTLMQSLELKREVMIFSMTFWRSRAVM